MPDAPADRSDLIAMGTWVADELDLADRLVWRTVVRNLVAEVEKLRADVDDVRGSLGSPLHALHVLLRYGQTDGAHHKAWVIDQAVRALTGHAYEETIAEWCDGDDGPETYAWDEGIAP